MVFLTTPNPDRLMPKAASLMRMADVRVSPITVWEITRKAALGKLSAVWGPYASLTALLRTEGFAVQPLGWDEAEQASRLPLHHKDPMDRMLIATALRNDLTIVTDDAAFAAYGVPTIW